MNKKYCLPKDLVIFISGVPGVGKTTISYQLLKMYKEFRLVEETDVMREVLRGYNSHLSSVYKTLQEDIYPHNIFLSYDMARQQCKIMKNSIINIVKRQQRKCIPSIINGVHIIPEELYLSLSFTNILYINLYIDSEEDLWDRLKDRDPIKYKPDCVSYLYQTNVALNNSIAKIPKNICNIYSINISSLSIEETLFRIDEIFCKIYNND